MIILYVPGLKEIADDAQSTMTFKKRCHSYTWVENINYWTNIIRTKREKKVSTRSDNSTRIKFLSFRYALFNTEITGILLFPVYCKCQNLSTINDRGIVNNFAVYD